MRNAMKVLRPPRPAPGALLLSGLLLASCGQKPAEIRVTPAKIQLFGKDRRASLKADVVDAKGNPVPDQKVTWESSNPKVAAVDPSGLVKSTGAGRAQVVAKLGALSASATVDVADVATMSLIPSRVTLVGPVGTTMTLIADVRDSKGQPVAAKLKWTTSDPKVVQVTEDGLVASAGEGKATITASLGSELSSGCEVRTLFREIASFEISPLTLILKTGDTQRINAIVRDKSGAVIEDPALVWSSSDPKVASVGGGIVRAEAPGTATISVSAGARSQSATVLVN
jgi:uncharacterized protein YjdB